MYNHCISLYSIDHESMNNSVKIKIKVPKDDKKKQFKFNGQVLTFTMKLNENIKELKQRIFLFPLLPCFINATSS